jgi:hypothetical protein
MKQTIWSEFVLEFAADLHREVALCQQSDPAAGELLAKGDAPIGLPSLRCLSRRCRPGQQAGFYPCISEAVSNALSATFRSRRDVLIDLKEIAGIEFPLDQRQPVKLVSVGCADAGLALIFEVVDIYRTGRERLHRSEELLDPSRRFPAIRGLLPVRMNPKFEARTAEAESIILGLGAPWAMPVHHGKAAGFMRSAGRIFDNRIDDVFGELFEVAAAPVTRMVSFWDVEACSLFVEIGFRLDGIFERLQVLAERP